MLRTIWCRNALACTSTSTIVAVARDGDRAAGRGAHAAPGSAPCGTRRSRVRPSSACAARCMASASSGRRSQLRYWRLQRRPHGAVEDPVAIAARTRGKARMEIVRHRHAPAHADRRRQARGRAEHPAARIARRCAVEMHHLARRMHAGIGASGADGSTRCAGDERQGLLQRRLHGRFIPPASRLTGLVQPLPAGEIAAVVFDAQRVAHRVSPCRATTSQVAQQARSSVARGRIAAVEHFAQQFARGVVVAEVQVGPCKLELLARVGGVGCHRCGGLAAPAGMPRSALPRLAGSSRRDGGEFGVRRVAGRSRRQCRSDSRRRRSLAVGAGDSSSTGRRRRNGRPPAPTECRRPAPRYRSRRGAGGSRRGDACSNHASSQPRAAPVPPTARPGWCAAAGRGCPVARCVVVAEGAVCAALVRLARRLLRRRELAVLHA